MNDFMPEAIARHYQKITTTRPSKKAGMRAANYFLSAGKGKEAANMLAKPFTQIGEPSGNPVLGVVLRHADNFPAIIEAVENTECFGKIAESALRSMTKDPRDVKTRNAEAQKTALYPALVKTLDYLKDHPRDARDSKKSTHVLEKQLEIEMKKLGYFDEIPDGSVILELLKMDRQAGDRFMQKLQGEHFDPEALPGNYHHFRAAKTKNRVDPNEIRRAVVGAGVPEDDAAILTNHIVAHAQDFAHAAWLRKMR